MEYAKFKKSMKKTHKLLLPQMLPLHFSLICDILSQDGYDMEILTNNGPAVVEEGLKYVHNDACYPALLVIGQFIDALKSGKYDLEKTVLLITQTGGGCRASNYLSMLRKALVKAGFSNIPVLSINFSKLEGDSSLKTGLKMLKKTAAAIFYADELMMLKNQIRPYENNAGDCQRLVEKWEGILKQELKKKNASKLKVLTKIFDEIAKDFSKVPATKTDKIKVGIVGEIYVKYSPLGNNDLEEFLFSEGCEVNVPGLLGFVQYCIYNSIHDIDLYGGKKLTRFIMQKVLNYTIKREKIMLNMIRKYPNLNAHKGFNHTKELADGFIDLGAKMGEGWLLTAEMVELVKTGFNNIVCAQPFGCLPNHVMGKGMISKIRHKYPTANIVPIDYDPSATKVNQVNRIKLMLAEAKHSAQIALKNKNDLPKMLIRKSKNYDKQEVV